MSKFGPYRIVCFGGGTGLPTLLRGLKYNNYWSNITAVVTMFDSGGASCELRDQFGSLPPSDFARCYLGLSQQEELLRQFWFKKSRRGYTALHRLISGNEKLTQNFADIIEDLKDWLQVAENHFVLPVTFSNSHLNAIAESDAVAENEVDVDELIKDGEIIKNLFLKPKALATNEVLQAIRRADVICIGPGSFYTSLLPNFLVQGVGQAIIRSTAPIIFISNLLKEGQGMRHLLLAEIVKIAEEHVGREFAKIIVNNSVPLGFDLEGYKSKEQKTPILFEELPVGDERFESASLWKNPEQAHHDSSILDKVVYSLTRELLNKG